MCANLTAPALAAEDTADTAAPGQTAITFTDMPSSPEFVESITWAVENGITTGMYDGQFWPDYTCNISQILTFIWRMSGSPEPAGENPFRDVPNGKWYAAAAVWAHEKGIVSGDTLHPDAPCTRAMTVTYLWRLAGSPSASASAFRDVKSTDDYAAAVAWGAENGIIKGHHPPTIFGPYNTCTRARISSPSFTVTAPPSSRKHRLKCEDPRKKLPFRKSRTGALLCFF